VDYARVYGYAQSLQLPKEALILTGEQTPYEVAQWMQQSDCFLLFSRYETFAVVLAEAMAVGIPFISSDTAGIAVELPSNCGILVPSENEVALANAMVKMLDNEGEIKTDEIRKQGDRYTYQAVGKQLSELYQRMIVSAN
jgi:glycosyltransferase involved in cell wall biosynthesis